MLQKLHPKQQFIKQLKQEVNLKKIKVAEKNLKPKPVSVSNSRNVERISIPPEKREITINGLE